MIGWLKRLFRRDVDMVPDIPADDQLPEKFRCLQLSPLAHKKRVETGVVMFGDDWPGVFIRGDNAFHFSMTLRATLKKHQKNIDDLDLMVLIGLLELLESSNVRGLPLEATPAPSVHIAALTQAAEQFEHYEKLHRKKGTEDGLKKAEVNKHFAGIMRAAIEGK